MKLCHLTKYIYYTIITLAVVALGGVVFFLYNNFYQTLTQAKVVYVLRSQVAFEIVDMDLWHKVLKNFQDKKTPRVEEGKIIDDPFGELVEVGE